MQRNGRIAFITFCLAGFLFLQATLISNTRSILADYSEPRLAWSTHSSVAETDPGAVLDRDLQTFWSDRGSLRPDNRRPPKPESYDGLYLMVSPGPTHRPGRKPAPDPLVAMRFHSGDTAKSRYPRRIRLSYFQQKLYQINQDYKFPDPPVFVLSRDFTLLRIDEPQDLSLEFLPTIMPSEGFPDQIYQRWFRVEILDVYGRKDDGAAIREITFLRASELEKANR